MTQETQQLAVQLITALRQDGLISTANLINNALMREVNKTEPVQAKRTGEISMSEIIARNKATNGEKKSVVPAVGDFVGFVAKSKVVGELQIDEIKKAWLSNEGTLVMDRKPESKSEVIETELLEQSRKDNIDLSMGEDLPNVEEINALADDTITETQTDEELLEIYGGVKGIKTFLTEKEINIAKNASKVKALEMLRGYLEHV